jgi:hypothetical protein
VETLLSQWIILSSEEPKIGSFDASRGIFVGMKKNEVLLDRPLDV